MTNHISEELLKFIEDSPSCFHVVKNVEDMLTGYTRLNEEDEWKLTRGGRYYVVRKDSSIVAFRVPMAGVKRVYITAAHTDYPTFKLKSNAAMITEDHYTRLNTEKYGGMIMTSWMDRPLSIAGRVVVKEGDKLVTKLVQMNRDLLLIPSVAIHMNRDVNNGVKLDAQIDTIPLFGDENAKDSLEDIIAKEACVDKGSILGSDLFLYVRGKGSVWGANNEYISSRALDDLQCAYGCVKGFIASEDNGKNYDDMLAMCCLFDNEEVGSLSSQGADSTFLADVIERIGEALDMSRSGMLQAIANGYMISADNAHAVHPNHTEYADPTNRPYLNGGIVIKYNANQKYTTDAHSEAMFRDICSKAGVPVQTFANKSNMAGGSTLGNIANRHISIKTIDIGLPQLSMHSAYETAGSKDTEYLIKAITEFYN